MRMMMMIVDYGSDSSRRQRLQKQSAAQNGIKWIIIIFFVVVLVNARPQSASARTETEKNSALHAFFNPSVAAAAGSVPKGHSLYFSCHIFQLVIIHLISSFFPTCSQPQQQQQLCLHICSFIYFIALFWRVQFPAITSSPLSPASPGFPF